MLTMPIVNGNGDRVETLLEQARNVCEALRVAKGTMCEAMPHGRNFQCNPSGDYQKARDEMYSMMEQIDAMTQTFYQMADTLCDERNRRNRR